MADKSNISWTDSTFNPWLGCTKISPACDNCYAESWGKRSGLVKWGNNPRRRTSKQKWKEPLKWQRQSDQFYAEHGRKRRVFCASLADVFDNQVPQEWRDDLWALIRECNQLKWMLLTKRPQNIERMLPDFWPDIREHVGLGFTAENQAEYTRRRSEIYGYDDPEFWFVSAEPLLGPIDLHLGDVLATEPDWVITGGESGPKFRAPNLEWFISLRDQCRAADIPFFFKQWGGRTPTAGGHELDGEVIQEFPR